MRNVRFVITLCLFILLGTHLVKAQTVTNPNDREYSLQTPQGIIRGMMMTPGMGEGYPVVLLIAGSGPTDMNGNSMQLGIQPNTLKLIAEGLAQKGIATVRFDKRGIASSAAAAKDEFSLRFDDYVNDVRLWIDKLAGDRRFKDVYVLGHSEGALIGMVSCRTNAKVKGFVSVAGPGKPMDKLIESQLSALPQDLKAIPSRIIRTLLLRLTLPSRTKQPAIVPTLVILNTSMISMVAVISSLISGESIPSIAALISSIAA